MKLKRVKISNDCRMKKRTMTFLSNQLKSLKRCVDSLFNENTPVYLIEC